MAGWLPLDGRTCPNETAAARAKYTRYKQLSDAACAGAMEPPAKRPLPSDPADIHDTVGALVCLAGDLSAGGGEAQPSQRTRAR